MKWFIFQREDGFLILAIRANDEIMAMEKLKLFHDLSRTVAFESYTGILSRGVVARGDTSENRTKILLTFDTRCGML